jgi:TonB family protein
MNRLQKKCLIASVVTHGSLLTLLVVGPAFLSREDKTPPAQILTMISSRVVDDAPSSDAASTPHLDQPAPLPAAPPPTAPPVAVAVPAPPVPPHQAPQPVVTPKPPEIPKLEKQGDEEFKRVNPSAIKPTTEFTPVTKPPTRAQVKPKPADPSATDSNAADIEAQKILAQRVANRIRKLTSTLAGDGAVQIAPGADHGEAVSNYRDIVYSMYYNAWQPPSSLTDDSATVTARVTINHNGRVTSHEITKPSSNAAANKSIENALDSVTFVLEFPAGSKDTERTYSIKFDITAKRSLE